MPAAFSLMQATLRFSAAPCVSFERLAPRKPKNICANPPLNHSFMTDFIRLCRRRLWLKVSETKINSKLIQLKMV